MEGAAPSAPVIPSEIDSAMPERLVSSSHRPSHLGRRRPTHTAILDRTDRATIVFVTVASHSRKPIFATPSGHSTLVAAWQLADAWAVGRYVVMPDHVHFFCAPRPEATPLESWIAFWKSTASRRWPRPSDQPIWQRDFWDTQLRRGDSYGAKWEYVRANPVRRGLVDSSDEWPYAGEIERLDWLGP